MTRCPNSEIDNRRNRVLKVSFVRPVLKSHVSVALIPRARGPKPEALLTQSVTEPYGTGR